MRKFLRRFAAIALAGMMMSSTVVTAQAAEPWRDAYANLMRNPKTFEEEGYAISESEYFKFVLHDFDNNGIPEMILYIPASGNTGRPYPVYSYVNNKTVRLGELWGFGVSGANGGGFTGVFAESDYGGPFLAERFISYNIVENGELRSNELYRKTETSTKESYEYDTIKEFFDNFTPESRKAYDEAFDLDFRAINESNIATYLYGWPSPTATTAAPTQNNAITVTINGTPVNFSGQAPVNVNGRVLVPVRGVFETLGFNVSWNEQARQATLSKATDTIVITLDSTTFTTNGIRHTLDVPAQSIGGSTMLPIRNLLESVGYGLSWNEAARTVVITTN